MESPPSPPSPSDALLLRQGGKPLPPASQCFPWRPHHFSARLTPHGASSPGGSSAVPHARGNTPTLEACRTQQASQGSTDTRALVSGAGKGREEAGGADNPEAQARAVQAEGMSGKPEDLAQRARLAEAQVDMAELQAQVVCAELQWIRSAVERQEAGVAAVLAELAGLRQRVHRARRCAEGGDGGDGAQESGEGKMREVQQVEAAVASAEARLWRVEAAAADARASLIALGGEAGGLGGLGGLAGIGAGEGGNVGGLCGECWCESGLGNRPVEGGIGVGCGGEVCGRMRGCAVLEGYGVGEVGLSAAEFALELQRRLEEVQKELVAKGQGHRVVQEKERRGVVEGPAGGVEGAGVSPSVEGKGEQPMVEGTERVKGAGQASGGVETDGFSVCEKACEKGTKESNCELLVGKQSRLEVTGRDGEVMKPEGEALSGAGELRFWDRISGESKLLSGGGGNGGVQGAAADFGGGKDIHVNIGLTSSATILASQARVNSTQMHQNQLFGSKARQWQPVSRTEDQEEAKILRDAMEYLKKEVERAQKAAPPLGAI
ncbi:unnamed protein product [Closterium sp. NIES-65]|nr:unnamed protein product [Closterium sp. NIES-65]